MKLSVVIPTRNRRHLLARTLPTVLNQNVAPGEYEVLVVSDGSTDGTADFVRGVKTTVPLRVLDRDHRGIAAAQNAGIEQARGDLVMVLDDDILCGPALMDRHLDAHQEDFFCVAFGPRFFSPESRPGLATAMLGNWYRDHARRLTQEGGPRGRFDVWLDSNFSVPRKLLLAHGGFDESLKYSTEDRELGTRLWDAGVRFKFLPDAPVYEIYTKSADDVVFSDAPSIGVDEIKFSRKAPGYRRFSLPASLLGQSRAKQMAWWMFCAPPISPDPVLRIPCLLTERLRRNARIESFGIRVLQYRKATAVMRSAMREAGSWRALRDEFGVLLPVLRYRAKVGCRFQAQVRWLARRGYVGITPSQWLAWVRRGAPLPERPVLISFEPAHGQLAEHALPVLRRYGFGAVVHVALAQTDGRPQSDRRSQPRPMTAEQIRYWAGHGIEFGLCGRSYSGLTEFEGPALTEEVASGLKDLEQVLGYRPVSFAYPHGPLDHAMVERVRQCFDLALSGAPGLNSLCTDPHLMRSAAITPDSHMRELACAVLFGRPKLRLRGWPGK